MIITRSPLRITFGGHFFTDVIFSGVFSFLIIWTIHGLIYRWPATRLDEKALQDRLGQAGDWLNDVLGNLTRRLAGQWKKAP